MRLPISDGSVHCCGAVPGEHTQAPRLNSKLLVAVRMAKQGLHRAHDLSAEQFLDLQNTLYAKQSSTTDALATFMEKRLPRFQGR